MVALLSRQVAQEHEQEARQRLSHGLAVHIIGHWPEITTAHPDPVNLAARQALLQMLMVVNPGIQVYLLDASGKVDAYIGEPGMVQQHPVAFMGSDTHPVRSNDQQGGRCCAAAARQQPDGRQHAAHLQRGDVPAGAGPAGTARRSLGGAGRWRPRCRGRSGRLAAGVAEGCAGRWPGPAGDLGPGRLDLPAPDPAAAPLGQPHAGLQAARRGGRARRHTGRLTHPGRRDPARSPAHSRA